jgi:hypothetical protein
MWLHVLYVKPLLQLFVFALKSVEKRAKMTAMPNVWYAECHEKAIVHLAESPYLCTVKSSQLDKQQQNIVLIKGKRRFSV